MEENVAVLVSMETFNAAMQFLATQPFNQVAGLIQNLQQSGGITAEQIALLNPQPEEEAPE